MAASPVSNIPPPQAESKSAKKKRAKKEVSISDRIATPTPSNPDTETKSEHATNGVSDDFDNGIFKDLQKNLRNTLKKLNATSKVDSIMAENPGKSLDELVADKKINPDQKAQALKKPSLQAHAAQLEEQIAQYKQFAAHYEERLTNQKTALENAHKEELEAAREKAVAEFKESQQKELQEQLLTLSRFLQAAGAIRRAGDETAAQSRAFEGILFQVYGGTYDAVDSMQKLINGVDEKVSAVEGDILDVTYGRVKQASEKYAPAVPEGTWTEEAPAMDAAPASDPTLANAGLTELQDTSVGMQQATANGFAPTGPSPPEEVSVAPSQTSVGDAANPRAESSWHPQASSSLEASATAEGWVEVPRNLSETDTGVQTTPASIQPSTSWAEEVQSEAPAVTNTEASTNDGFEQVIHHHHHQRQNSTRGRGGRGRGRSDGFRGRGGRGEFRGRGRGRGEFKGGRGRGSFGGQQSHRGEPIASQ